MATRVDITLVRREDASKQDIEQRVQRNFLEVARLKLASIPGRAYRKLVVDQRPPVTTKTRESEWPKILKQRRYLQAVWPYVGPPSYILWEIRWPLLFVMALGTVNVLLRAINACCDGDLWHFQALTSVQFTVSGWLLSLLLSLRLGRAVDRFWQAIAGVRLAGSHTNIVQKVLAMTDDEEVAAEFARWLVVYHYGVVQFLREDPCLDPVAAEYLSKDELAAYNASKKGRQLALLKIRMLLADLRRRYPTDVRRWEQLITNLCAESMLFSSFDEVDIPNFTAIDSMLLQITSTTSAVARIKYHCSPYGITLLGTGSVCIYLSLFALDASLRMDPSKSDVHLFPVNVWFNAAFSLLQLFVISVFMLGVDVLAVQLDHPFPYMPLGELALSSKSDCFRAIREHAQLKALLNGEAPSAS